MIIVHLSDIHYKKRYFDEYYNMYEALFMDVRSYINNEQVLVIITGDLIDSESAESQVESLEESYDLIKLHASEIGINSSNIIITPGNHDINKKVYNPTDFEKVGIDDRLTRKVFEMAYFDDENTFKDYFKSIEDFYHFQKTVVKGNNKVVSTTPFESTYSFNSSNGNVVKVISLNNVWRYREYRHNESPYGDMFFGTPQLKKAKEFSKTGDLKIAFSHYPFEFINEEEKREGERIILQNYDLFLCGHAHSSNNHLIAGPGDQHNGGCIFNYGGNLNIANDTTRDNRYDLVYDLINITENEYVINHRKYSFTSNKFVSNTSFGDGISQYFIRNDKSESLNILRDYLSNQMKSFDKKLISSSLGNTHAPKKLNDLFVSPNLKRFDEIQEAESKIDIQYVLKEKPDIIIFSKSESGKSTFLYALFDNLYKGSLYHGNYPLYIDYLESDKHNTIFEALYSKYPITRKSDFKEFLNSTKITLLIDNIDLKDNEYNSSIIELKKEIQNIQVICTSLITLSGRIPIPYIESKLLDLQAYELLPFNTNQIKTFSSKWLNGATDESESEVRKLIDMVNKNRISTYPVFVSMFLWLLEEKKTLKRLDYNMMTENFVDKLLEKTKTSNNTFDAFDFHNRRELLGIIAENIVRKSSVGSINESMINRVIGDYLESKEWAILYRVGDVFEYLLQTNILISEGEHNQFLRFRYNCVLNYFIAVRMEYSKEFYNYITEKERVLQYVEVIDMYTSRNRFDYSLLPLLNSILDNHIGKLHEMISLQDIDKSFSRSQSFIPLLQTKKSLEKRKEAGDINRLREIDKKLQEHEKHNEMPVDFSDRQLKSIEEFERVVVMLANMSRNLEGDYESVSKNEIINKVFDASVYLGYLFDYLFKKQFFKTNDENLLPIITVSSFFTPVVIKTFLSDYMDTIKLHQQFSKLLTDMEEDKVESSLIKEFLVRTLLFDNSPNKLHDFNELESYGNKIKEVFIEDNFFTFIRIAEISCNDTALERKFSKFTESYQKRHKNWEQKKKIDVESTANRKMKLIEEFKTNKNTSRKK